MKQRTHTGARPEYTILERSGVFKVFDRNQHFRCSFATRQAAHRQGAGAGHGRHDTGSSKRLTS